MNDSFVNTQLNVFSETINKIGIQITNAVSTAMNFVSIGSSVKSGETTNLYNHSSSNFNKNFNNEMGTERTKEEQDLMNLTSVLWAKF